MDSNNTEAGMKDLVKKLSSLDPIVSHSGINQYFDSQAVLATKTVRLAGIDRIKKQFDLYNRAFKGTEVVGEPRYNEKEQVIQFVVARLVQSPKLPSIVLQLPLVHKLSEVRKYIHFNATLHLNADGVAGENGKGSAKLMVTKLDVDRREQAPLENLIPYYLLKPFLSPLANIIATVAGIVLAFPFTPRGFLSMVGAIINSFFLWSFSKVAKAQEKLFPQTVTWANGPDSDLPAFAAQTARTGLQVIEGQAKKMGLPVEEYKEKAMSVSRDVIDKTHQSLERLHGQAEQAGEKVKESVQEGVQKATDIDLDNVEKSPKGVSPKDSASSSKPSAYKEDLPQTPLGGTDPLAKDAPSYAQATEEGDQTPTQHGYKGLEPSQVQSSQTQQPRDDLPQTPLGGTDPLAKGAPSYAKAIEEADESSTERGYKGLEPKQSEQPRDDLPQTPLGGTDPLAKGAPSYAQAIDDGEESSTQRGYKGIGSTQTEQAQDELPHTPLGGTDPLAKGAPSYAGAAAE